MQTPNKMSIFVYRDRKTSEIQKTYFSRLRISYKEAGLPLW